MKILSKTERNFIVGGGRCCCGGEKNFMDEVSMSNFGGPSNPVEACLGPHFKCLMVCKKEYRGFEYYAYIEDSTVPNCRDAEAIRMASKIEWRI